MCGRNSLYVNDKKLRERYNASMNQSWNKNYNISPGNAQPTVTKNSPKSIDIKTWSLVPGFVDESEESKWKRRNLINARVETVHDKGMFKKAFRENKCLIPSTGFYEWKEEGKTSKTPYHIKPENKQVFSFAGFYNDRTFIILTKDSENSKMKDIHDRTPVILSREEEEDYLDGEVNRKALEEKVIEGIETEQVSRKVNDPSNNSPEVLDLESRQTRLG
jgi:putative SOS response-associated peptidase YedK